MTARLSDYLGWAAYGTDLVLVNLDEASLAAPSGLPGWSRRHLLAHLAANADALGNLVHWAATGEPTPMYASSAERGAGIERGARLPAAQLAAWLRSSAEHQATPESDDRRARTRPAGGNLPLMPDPARLGQRR